MTTLEDRLRQDVAEAMREGNTSRRDVLRMMLAAKAGKSLKRPESTEPVDKSFARKVAGVYQFGKRRRRVFESNARWTVVRGSDLEEGESQGLPVWSEHVGDPILASNMTRRTDFALFMVAALEDDALVGEAPAIVGRGAESARAPSR